MSFWEEFDLSKQSQHLRKRVLLRLFGCVVRLHWFREPDNSGVYHGHPATAFRLILRGGYIEELPDGTQKIWRPRMFGRVTPDYQHRIIALLDQNRGSLSLWFRGRRRPEPVATTKVQ